MSNQPTVEYLQSLADMAVKALDDADAGSLLAMHIYTELPAAQLGPILIQVLLINARMRRDLSLAQNALVGARTDLEGDEGA